MKWSDEQLDRLVADMKAVNDAGYWLGVKTGIALTVFGFVLVGVLGYACLRWWGLI